MASSTAFASLSVPVLDDSMELTTSPRASHADNDIDLDLDDYGVVQLTDDERMMEDPQPTRPGTADDMMEDAEQAAGISVVEEVMQDDPVNVTSYDDDEELIDYSDDEYQEDVPVTNEYDITENAEGSILAPTETATEPELVDEEIVRKPEDVAVEEVSVPAELANDVAPPEENEEEAQDVTAQGSGDVHHEAQVEDVSAKEIADLEQATTLVSDSPDLSGATVTAEAEDEDEGPLVDSQQHHDADADEDEAARKLPGSLDSSASYPPEGPGTPTDTGMHPMTVRYGDLVMPLFKSRAQPGGLLKDDNLASLSINNLLTNCRQRLESKMGESISPDQDLAVSFETMGLIVSENSPYSFERSLSEILDVYVQLHQNDGVEVIPPLTLSLSLQLKFPSSFNLLKMAAQQGQGMSSFSFLRDEENDDAYYEEQEGEFVEEEGQEYFAGGNDARDSETAGHDFVDGEFAQQAQEGQEYEEEHDAEYEEGNEYEGQDWDEYPEDQQTSPIHGGPTEDQQHETTANEAYEEHDEQKQEETNDSPHDHNPSAGDPAADDKAHHSGEPEDYHTAAEADASEVQSEQVATNSDEPESAASSATIPNEISNDVTGEYKFEEDLIDYEDDDLTAWPEEYPADNGENELEALASELEEAEDAATATAKSEGVQQANQVIDDRAGNEDILNFEFRNLAHPQDEEEELIDYPSDDDDQPFTAEDDTADQLANDGNDYSNQDEPTDDQAVPEGEDNIAFDLLEDHELQHGAGNNVTGGQPAAHAYSAEYDEDRIDFEEDDDAVQPPNVASTSNSNSPLGKRSFDEHDNGNTTSEQPDLKKARAG